MSDHRIGYIAFAFIISIVLGLLMTPARGHDGYEHLTNPVTGVSCCNGRDCHPVDPKEIGEDGASYTWRGARFPKNQSQQSPDHQYHICSGMEWSHNGTGRPLIRCLLRPFSGA